MGWQFAPEGRISGEGTYNDISVKCYVLRPKK